MKICYVANSRFPSERAHVTQIVHMCNAFVQNGHQVTLLITDRKTPISVAPDIFFGVPILFTIKRIPVLDIAGRSPSIPVLFRPATFLIQRLCFTFGAFRYLTKNPSDVVYGRDEWILWFLTCLGINSVTWESHEGKYTFAARALLQKIKQFIVISEGIRDFYLGKGIPKERMLVAHDAVDERFFKKHISKKQAREKLSISTEKPVVMYIGGLDAWKGVETFLKAANAQKTYEAYVIGGKDNEIAKMKHTYPNVYFLGYYSYNELPELQQAADVLVIPNTAKNKVSAEYTSPLKLFAYMTSGIPIVASNIPSLTHILSEDDAYFFTADDHTALHETICRALTDHTTSGMKAQHASIKSFQYTWSSRAKALADVFTHLNTAK